MGKKRKAHSAGSPRARRRVGRGGRHSGNLPIGTLSVTSQGYGFAETPEGRFFIPQNKIHGAMDGDVVRVRPISQDWRKQQMRATAAASNASDDGGAGTSDAAQAPLALVDRVIDRGTREVVGKYVVFEGMGYLIPHDTRLDYLIRANVPAAIAVSDGDIVMLSIDTYPTKRETPAGTVQRVIGREDDPGIIEEIFAARHGIETSFSAAALQEADACALDIDAALREPDRRDIRDRMVLTIDPADARDFDDALSLDFVDGAMRLGVHIADVSSYVRCGSSLDLDARRRGTSTYFPNRVIPMLPEKLSNGLCSLNPGEDRLSFTVDIYMDRNGSVSKTEMYPSVIRSRLRLDYDGVQRMFDGEEAYPSDEARQVLDNLHRISRKLRERRMRRGALDFEGMELKVTFGADGKPNGIIKRRRSDATELVEECMIAANEAVAAYMLERDAPMVYRIHEDPNPSSLEEIVPVLREFGYAQHEVPVSNRQIQAILDDAQGKPIYPIVSSLLLRAMKQAAYRDHYTSHFGLASPGYTHFTSPIRRYPDLMAHRLLRLRLFQDAYPSNPPARPGAIVDISNMIDQLAWLCDSSSVMEREAEKASYDALNSKICEYMEQFVGERFGSIIVNVMQFGFFVRLDNGCEGLVPTGELDGWFDYDEAKRTLSRTDSGVDIVYALGQRIHVVLTKSNKYRGKLTFSLA